VAAIPNPDDSAPADDQAPVGTNNNPPAETKSKHQLRAVDSNRKVLICFNLIELQEYCQFWGAKRQEGPGGQAQSQTEIGLAQVGVNNGNGPPALPGGVGAPNPVPFQPAASAVVPFGPPHVPFDQFQGAAAHGGPLGPAPQAAEPFPAPVGGHAPSFGPQPGQGEGGEAQRQKSWF